MKTFQKKSRPSGENLCLFLSFPSNYSLIYVQSVPSDSCMDHTTCCTYKDVFPRELLNTIQKSDIGKVPNFSFFQL